MINIIGISGSLRKGSYNTALLHAISDLAPSGCNIEIVSIENIPLYNGDIEAAQGIPDSVSKLKEAIAISDGLILVSPEYNHSIPGVAKNAIDWLSRPNTDIRRVFGGKPIAISGASPGGYGTILGQNAWLPVLLTLGAEIWSGGHLAVSHAGSVFDDHGEVKDQSTREHIQKYIEGFAAYINDRNNS